MPKPSFWLVPQGEHPKQACISQCFEGLPEHARSHIVVPHVAGFLGRYPRPSRQQAQSQCALIRVPADWGLVSTTHGVLQELAEGQVQWQDTSRNGSWHQKPGKDSDPVHTKTGRKVLLDVGDSLCLSPAGDKQIEVLYTLCKIPEEVRAALLEQYRSTSKAGSHEGEKLKSATATKGSKAITCEGCERRESQISKQRTELDDKVVQYNKEAAQHALTRSEKDDALKQLAAEQKTRQKAENTTEELTKQLEEAKAALENTVPGSDLEALTKKLEAAEAEKEKVAAEKAKLAAEMAMKVKALTEARDAAKAEADALRGEQESAQKAAEEEKAAASTCLEGIRKDLAAAQAELKQAEEQRDAAGGALQELQSTLKEERAAWGAKQSSLHQELQEAQAHRREVEAEKGKLSLAYESVLSYFHSGTAIERVFNFLGQQLLSSEASAKTFRSGVQDLIDRDIGEPHEHQEGQAGASALHTDVFPVLSPESTRPLRLDLSGSQVVSNLVTTATEPLRPPASAAIDVVPETQCLIAPGTSLSFRDALQPASVPRPRLDEEGPSKSASQAEGDHDGQHGSASERSEGREPSAAAAPTVVADADGTCTSPEKHTTRDDAANDDDSDVMEVETDAAASDRQPSLGRQPLLGRQPSQDERTVSEKGASEGAGRESGEEAGSPQVGKKRSRDSQDTGEEERRNDSSQENAGARFKGAVEQMTGSGDALRDIESHRNSQHVDAAVRQERDQSRDGSEGHKAGGNLGTSDLAKRLSAMSRHASMVAE